MILSMTSTMTDLIFLWLNLYSIGDNKMKYKISVRGCDDSTIFEVELTAAEYSTVKMVADTCTDKSEYG